MKPLIRLAAKLYPPRWRQRYGAEFEALLDDTNPDLKTALDVFSGAISMQIRTWSIGKILAVTASVGVLAAIGVVLAMPKSYSSQSVLKIATNGQVSDADRESIMAMANEVESRQMLTHLIQAHGLYPADRSRLPLEDVIEKMRSNISIIPIQSTSGSMPAFSVQFNYPDPVLAQRVTADLTSKLIDANLGQRSRIAFQAHAAHRELEPGLMLQVIDPASPAQPLPTPNVLLIAFAGLAGGLLLGAILAFRTWKIVAATALAGALIAAGIAWFLPRQYESITVVRITAPSPQESGSNINALASTVASRESLTQIVTQFGLYPKERGKMPLEDVLERMKRSISILPMNGAAFAIHFQYSDPQLTQKVAQLLAAKFIDLNFQQASATPNPVTLQLLDPANLPQNPLFPNTRNFAGLGLGAGILLGAILAFRFRPRPQVASS
ncbi:MAG TPA: hypothetical protein VGN17_20530 [Bryobacteraceae bacterium]|jgi:uncharacterized protein involved in exopolysaccharide biosynthesis